MIKIFGKIIALCKIIYCPHCDKAVSGSPGSSVRCGNCKESVTIPR